MITIPDLYRPSPKYPVYPPYHTGPYLEDYFYGYSKGKTFNRTYIPISWTTIYCDNLPINIQGILDRLPIDGKYFTVCQHDDAPRERLPKDTMVFSAGGNVINSQITPIPLICSPIRLNENKYSDKNIFCSFVGSLTHPIRNILHEKYKNNPNYVFSCDRWSPSVSRDAFARFKTITENSKFTLCPRGYGKSSFRLYEAMQLGSIPVYVSDYHYLPYIDKIDWSEIAVVIKPHQIEILDDILKSISDEQQEKMRSKIDEIYDDYFSLEGMSRQIHRMVNT